MSAIDLSDVKTGTYVSVDGVQCKSLSIDNEKVWEYKPSFVLYDGNPDDYVGKEADISGYGFTGSSSGFVNAKLSNLGSTTFVIKPSGSYSFPVGQNKVSMRDEEYFLTMDISFIENPMGASTSRTQHNLKFNRQYKKVIVPYDIWNNGFTGIDDLQLRISFGDDSKILDILDAIMGDVTLESTTPSDTITFEFVAYGSITTSREVTDLMLIVDSIRAYVE